MAISKQMTRIPRQQLFFFWSINIIDWVVATIGKDKKFLEFIAILKAILGLVFVDIEDDDKTRVRNCSPNDDKIKDTRFNRDNIDTKDLRQQILTTFL